MDPRLLRGLIGGGLGGAAGAIGAGHGHRLEGALGGALGGGAIGALTGSAPVPPPSLGERATQLGSSLEEGLRQHFPEIHQQFATERATAGLDPNLGPAGPSKLGSFFQAGYAAAIKRYAR
jgi:hypothetical protein